MTLTVGSLFSGIGGIDLGLELAGMKVRWQVEIDPWCQRVLEKHWPNVDRYEDVREVGAHNLERVDVVAGGFPCQDISYAGRGAGLAGARSGLWSEFARIVCELRPRYVVVENVPALRSRGLEVVVSDLAAGGYDAEWDCVPASAVGAPHRRDRIWIVGYAREFGTPGSVPDPERDELRDERQRHKASERADEGPAVAGDDGAEGLVADSSRRSSPRHAEGFGSSRECDWWRSEPAVGRVADGIPARVDRLRGLGNAVVPQVAELIGRLIVEAEKEVAA